MARLLMTSHFAPATAQISANFQCQTLNACKELSHILLCANLCKMCARLDPHKIFCLQTRCSRITHPKKSRKIKVCPSTFFPQHGVLRSVTQRTQIFFATFHPKKHCFAAICLSLTQVQTALFCMRPICWNKTVTLVVKSSPEFDRSSPMCFDSL